MPAIKASVRQEVVTRAGEPQTSPNSSWPEGFFIQLLGGFRLLKAGAPITLRPGGKSEHLVMVLALNQRRGLSTEELADMVWPGNDPLLATQSVRSLIRWLHRRIGESPVGKRLISRLGGRYVLRVGDNVRLDVVEFESAVAEGDRDARRGDVGAAIASYEGATRAYAGEMVIESDVRQLVERERLRALYLKILMRLADLRFSLADYQGALSCASEMLQHDPCREDAYRLAMRCYVRLGERAQAFREYALCRKVLAAEFDTLPERETEMVFEQIRTAPDLC